jgi:phage terminase large subunit GpA-like protein
MRYRADRLYPIGVLQARELMNAAELAIKTRYMPSTSSMFSYDQTPYLYDPTAALSDISSTLGVVIKSPAQVGKSTTIENFLAWIVEYDRANTMIILDTQKSAEKMSRNRIRPFLRTRGINNPANARAKDPDKSNSVVNIGLGSGANLFLCSAKSPSDLRSTPSKYCAFDEVDAWPDILPGEGDPLQNAIQRMMRFRGMYLLTSTPTDIDGRIYQNFLLGTRQTWCAVCECGALMDCKFDDINFNDDIPVYACKSCGTVYTEKDIIALPHRYSDPQNKSPLDDKYGRVLRSYEVYGTLCHQFYTWDYLKKLEIASLQLGEASYQSFRNTRLGEVYKPIDDIEVEKTELMRCCLDNDLNPDFLPDDIAGICIGCDTHDNCLYCFTAGYTLNAKRVYGLDYEILLGNPDEKEVWGQLKAKMDKRYTLSDGRVLRPSFCCIDSGGHRTNGVYIHTLMEPRLMAIKGFVYNTPNRADPLVGPVKKYPIPHGVKGKCKVLNLGVNAGKDDLASKCLATISGEKSLVYRLTKCFNIEYFSGLLSEKKIAGKWKAKSHVHNEPLDTFVYALAAFIYWRDTYLLTGKDREVSEMKKKKNKSNVENVTDQKVEIVDEKQSHEVSATADNPNPITPKPQKPIPHW